MITNLIASIVVTVVTNTVEEFPKHLEAIANPVQRTESGAFFSDALFRAQWVNDANPTVKTNRTICKEITTLKLDWNGPREIVTERVLWERTQVLRLEWNPEKK